MFGRSSPMYFNTPVTQDESPKNEDENISYWLKKLHIQKEASIEADKTKKQSTGTTYNRLQAISSTNRSPPHSQKNEKTLEEKGQDESIKNQAAQIEEDRQSLDELVKSSNRCIVSISSGFFWTLFPNTINVEEGRVTFIFRQFLSTQSHSVDIKDISNVFIESSLFFSTLQIVSKTFIQNDIRIGNLSKKEAINVRMIIEGLRILAAHKINTSNYRVDELISKIGEMHASQGGQVD